MERITTLVTYPSSHFLDIVSRHLEANSHIRNWTVTVASDRPCEDARRIRIASSRGLAVPLL